MTSVFPLSQTQPTVVNPVRRRSSTRISLVIFPLNNNFWLTLLLMIYIQRTVFGLTGCFYSIIHCSWTALKSHELPMTRCLVDLQPKPQGYMMPPPQMHYNGHFTEPYTSSQGKHCMKVGLCCHVLNLIFVTSLK